MYKELQLQIKRMKPVSQRPEQSELSKKIIFHCIRLIHEYGFEAFTFKKPCKDSECSETGTLQSFFLR